ncbi:phosphatase PAP2 family protein [Caloramator quimbayensis]|uniref:phosphatase PAP2 family protein n=1 Tax=Caloramator quimbayensis TaxID=1147123 RepID=UPI000999854E|nr:phosphatase PAP2 family protein [Caloramator quimbayensis]
MPYNDYLWEKFFKNCWLSELFNPFNEPFYSYFLKNKFERPRPYNILNDVNNFNIVLRDYSFPLGHTTAAFSVCMTLSLLFPVFCVFFILIALIVRFTRIYLGVHYPTDVVVGMFIGIICSVLTNIVFSFLYI